MVETAREKGMAYPSTQYRIAAKKNKVTSGNGLTVISKPAGNVPTYLQGRRVWQALMVCFYVEGSCEGLG